MFFYVVMIFRIDMNLNKNFFGVFITLAVFSAVSVVRGHKDIASIFTDDTFIDDDICSSTINDHPCVKNVLAVLVDHINLNMQRIRVLEEDRLKETKENEQKIKMIEDLLAQQKVNEEKLNSVQNELVGKTQEIKELEKINKLFKTRLNNIETKLEPQSAESTSNFLTSFLKKFGKSYELLRDHVDKTYDTKREKTDNSTLVSH